MKEKEAQLLDIKKGRYLTDYADFLSVESIVKLEKNLNDRTYTGEHQMIDLTLDDDLDETPQQPIVKKENTDQISEGNSKINNFFSVDSLS